MTRRGGEKRREERREEKRKEKRREEKRREEKRREEKRRKEKKREEKGEKEEKEEKREKIDDKSCAWYVLAFVRGARMSQCPLCFSRRDVARPITSVPWPPLPPKGKNLRRTFSRHESICPSISQSLYKSIHQ